MKKLRLIVCTVILTLVATTAGAFACTGVYVGKDVSQDGTTIIARSEDQGGGAYNKMFKVQKRVTKAGRYLTDESTGFKVKLPKTTYKYTYVPDASDANDGPYYASCTNEYGVAVVGTISTGVSDEYAALDPNKEYTKGLRESILPGLIACQSKTAKEAAQICAKLHDKYGSEECNTLLFSDQKEAWIFENYGGYTYCAMKLPADKVAVFGNQIMIDWVDPADESGDYIYSKDLFANLDKLSTVVKKDGKYNLVESMNPGPRDEYSNMRNWAGMRTLAGEEAAGEYSDEVFYPLLYSPSGKVSVLEIMDLYRNRYEGTPYDMNLAGNEGRRPIATTRSSDIHIIQTYSGLPKDACQVQWLCMGNAEHSVFVPTFSGITDTLGAYKVDGSAVQTSSAYWKYKRIATLAQADRAFLSAGTKAFWKNQETAQYEKIQKELAKVKAAYKKSKTSGRTYVTKLGKTMAQAQLNNSDVLYRALKYTATNNDNDRPNNQRKAVFVKPVKLVSAAKAAGFTVKVSGNTYTLAKDGVKYKLVKNSKGFHKDGVYTDDLTYPIFKSHGTTYAPADFADSLLDA